MSKMEKSNILLCLPVSHILSISYKVGIIKQYVFQSL